MEGERRKRKLENNEEESEEEKLEKFYELIRSTKDVRDRLANNKDKEDKKDSFLEKDKGVWWPKFQPEDFTDDYYQQGLIRSPHDSSSNPSVRPSPSTPAKHDDVVQVTDKLPPQATAPAPPPQTEDDEKANDHVDLNLSL
ncbi:hypothetical protein QN277_021791 [Acacia crassicarpa]|uniref:NIM1-interacting protein n=1 Tax=Acacia crassicarpa TaxID=499986 RepID=A0AAE1JMI6_9FABA|nr:hypothetical protein QN277_021791 [Acacia crassicarpa]